MPTGIGDEVAWWCPSLDDSGNDTTTLNDLIGSNDGTLQNFASAAAAWVDDTTSGGVRCIEFDGGNDRIMMSTYVDFGTSDYALSFWVLHDNPEDSGNDVLLWNRDLTSPDNGVVFWLEDDSGDNTLQLLQDDGAALETGNSSTDITASTWTHVGVNVDRSGNATFYRSGSADGTLSVTGTQLTLTDTSPTLRLGCDHNGNNCFKGRIDDIRIWKRLLTAGEWTNLASQRAFQPDGHKAGTLALTGVGI